MFDAVLFDLDGTLITYRNSYADFMRRIAASWNILDEQDPFFVAYSQSIVADGPVTFTSAIGAALFASGKILEDTPAEVCRDAVAEYARGTELLPWTLNLLERYAKFPKAIVSNGPYDMQFAAIRRHDLHSSVDHILISGDPEIGLRKPNSAIFHLACSKLGANPSRVLMIGDNELADIQGARDAGLQAVLVSELNLGSSR